MMLRAVSISSLFWHGLASVIVTVVAMVLRKFFLL